MIAKRGHLAVLTLWGRNFREPSDKRSYKSKRVLIDTVRM